MLTEGGERVGVWVVRCGTEGGKRKGEEGVCGEEEEVVVWGMLWKGRRV